MTVYLDLVMGLNFGVDFLLLLGTNRLSGFPPGWKRCALAALLGGLYSGGCMLPGFRFLGNTLWRLVCLGIMGSIAFGLNPAALKRTGVFVLLSMAMGGIALGFGRNDFGMLILSAAVTWLLCRVGFGKRVGGREYVTVSIGSGEEKVDLIALRDSGNTLTDPITGEQVLVVGPETAEKLTGLTGDQLKKPMETLVSRRQSGLRLIPYNAVGQPGGMLLAKRFGQVKVGQWQGSALIAFAPETIGRGDVYQALAGGV